MSDQGESIWQTKYLALAFLLSLLFLRVVVVDLLNWLLRKGKYE